MKGELVEVTLEEGGREAVVARAEVLRSWWRRARGLLGTRLDSGARCVLLTPCASVHTFGMRYAIDVALVGESGEVLGSWRGLRPGRLVRVRGACHALERPSVPGSWPCVGQQLGIRIVDEET